MLVAELILRRTYIKDQIKELESYLATLKDYDVKNKGTLYTAVISKLFKLYDKLQKYDLILEDSNNNTSVSFNDTVVTVASAIKAWLKVEKKIEVIARLINSDITIDIFELIDQRDKLIEEYMILAKTIRSSDWSTEID